MKRLKHVGFWGWIGLMISSILLTSCGSISQFIPKPSSGGLTPSAGTTPAAGLPVTGNQPSVVVNDQATDGTSVVVAKVISKGPGWMAIHNQENGNVGPVIGVTHLKDGENDNVTVKIDASKATPTLYAMLHTDAGAVDTYEFPGPDVPVTLNGQMVSPSFTTSKGAGSAQNPSITIQDQDVKNGKVMVDRVIANGPGWVDIHVQNPDGTSGKEVGYTAVHAGENRNVVVTIDPKQVTGVMYAMLHIDAGSPGVFENPGADTAIQVNGQSVSSAFKTGPAGSVAQGGPTQAMNMPGMTATSPSPATQANPPAAATAVPAPTQGMIMVTPSGGQNPGVRISDQQVQGGNVKIDDVVSAGPGWVVIYTVTDNQPDQPIGQTHLNDGDNPNVSVQVDQNRVTDRLYAQLHVDAGTPGTFEFPGPDVPVMMGVRMISGMFNAKAVASSPTQVPDQTPAITVQDQPVHNGAIVIPHVVSNGESWLVIHPQNPDGSTGDFIGFAPVHAGATDNVVVHIDTNRATRTLYAMLHVNASKAAVPQFPGADEPIMVGGQMLLPPFKITGPIGGDVPLAVAKNSAGVNNLTDGLGMSLYLSLNDTPGKSNCTGDCLKNWHPLLASGTLTAGDGVSVNKVGVIFLPDRTRQVTYAGSPLYYYAGDQNPGDTKGQGVDGSWFLVTP